MARRSRVAREARFQEGVFTHSTWVRIPPGPPNLDTLWFARYSEVMPTDEVLRELVDLHMATPSGRVLLAKSLIGYFQGRAQSLIQMASSQDPFLNGSHYGVGSFTSPLAEETWNRLLEHGLNPDEIQMFENISPTLTEARSEAFRLYNEALEVRRAKAESLATQGL